MSQNDSKSRIKIGPLIALVGTLSSPIWGAFLEALLEQNGVFNDPNSIVAFVLSSGLSFITSQLFIYAAVFGSGALCLYLFLKWGQPRNPQKDDETAEQNKRQNLVAILNSINRILTDSEPRAFDREDENVIQLLFRNQRPRLESLNITLRKFGFNPIDFRSFNIHERELLRYLHEKVSALLNDGHVTEAHDQATKLFHDADTVLDRTDQTRPVRWIIDADGDLYCPNHDYLIQRNRLRETRYSGDDQLYEWPVHLSEKTWFELGPFLDVFRSMLESSEGGIDEEMYRRTREAAVRRLQQRR